MFRVSSSRFNNYPAYEFNLEPLDFYQVNNEDLYIVCRAGGSTDDCVQTGSQEYINGWLYGAVQAACGQLRKRMESYPELRNYDEDHEYDMNREPDDVPGNELGRYEIVFKVHGGHYYCFADAVNMDEALGQFFKHHPNITYGMVVDHMEV